MSIMTTHTTQGVASRLGYALGIIVRAFWFSQNRTLRWVKRLALIAVVIFFYSYILSVTFSVVLFTLIFGGVFWALKNSESVSSGRKTIEYGSGYGPQGYGYYKAGRRVDDDD